MSMTTQWSHPSRCHDNPIVTATTREYQNPPLPRYDNPKPMLDNRMPTSRCPRQSLAQDLQQPSTKTHNTRFSHTHTQTQYRPPSRATPLQHTPRARSHPKVAGAIKTVLAPGQRPTIPWSRPMDGVWMVHGLGAGTEPHNPPIPAYG